MNEKTEQVRVLFAITEHGSGKTLAARLANRGVTCAFQAVGRGTAASDMMSFLGLGSREKDVMLFMGRQSAVETVVREFLDNLRSPVKGKGIMMSLSPNAVSNLFAVMLSLNAPTEEKEKKEAQTTLKDEYSHSLVVISVNQGYTDAVMQTARRAGATGGTVIKARMVAPERSAQTLGMNLQGERELVAILAPDTIRDEIMNEVNREHGLRTNAQGILCALPVDKAFKI